MIGAEDFLTSSGAKWTPDGKKLLLLGGAGRRRWRRCSGTSQQLYSVALTRVTKNPDDRDVDTEEQAQAAGPTARAAAAAGRGGGGGGGGSTTKPDVKIEWDGLDRRIRQLTRLGSGSVTSVVPSPDSRTYAFVAFGGGSDEDGAGLGGPVALHDRRGRLAPDAPVADADRESVGGRPAPGRRGGGRGGIGQLQWSQGRPDDLLHAGQRHLRRRCASAPAGGDGGAASAGGGLRRPRPTRRPVRRACGGGGSTASSGATPRRISFTVRLEVDQAAERRQVFEEAWRVMKNRFYDPKMHGVDWDAAKETYEPLLADVADTDELHNVIMQMIGELNASHTGISGGGGPGDPAGQRAADAATPASTSSPTRRRLLQGRPHLQEGPGRPRLREARRRAITSSRSTARS